MNYLRTHFRSAYSDEADLEARCLLAFSAAIASDLIAAEHPEHTREQILQRAATLLFSGSTGDQVNATASEPRA